MCISANVIKGNNFESSCLLPATMKAFQMRSTITSYPPFRKEVELKTTELLLLKVQLFKSNELAYSE